MKGMGNVVIWALVCVVAFALYFFAGKAQFNRKIGVVRQDIDSLTIQLTETKIMEERIPELVGELPRWRNQMAILKDAIPTEIDDQAFIASLATLLDKHGAQLLAYEMVDSGPWLTGLKDDDVKLLESRGVDVATARKIQAALYSITLQGDFGAVLRAFEELKSYNRIYTIDQVLGPAMGDAGMISETLDPAKVPIRITGRVFFGIPANYADLDKLDEMIQRIVITPVARQVQQQITNGGQKLLDGDLKRDPQTPVAPDAGSAVQPPADDGQPVATAAPSGEGIVP